LPRFVQNEFEAYLKCGLLEHSLMRVRCTECHREKFVAFSCKRRGFCPSCGARRMATRPPSSCGADTPEKMAAAASAYTGARALKLKLTGEPSDAERARAVRAARPQVWLGVDANQGFSHASLARLMSTLVDTRMALIEQPFPIGQEWLLDGFDSPIPVAADESAQSPQDLPGVVGRFRVVNIKLDKCGGLTEALAMARPAQALGLKAMVGNMLGTSPAMAPAFLVGQRCEVVDLDGPVLLKADRAMAVRYEHGSVSCPQALWG
jgi:L-Ala-D/L-Glu epimerase